MPCGCEFICKNEECEYLNKGFVITAPWPMGDIDNMIYILSKKPFNKNS